MLAELSAAEKAVGLKQSRKAIREERAKRVFLAGDADPLIIEPVQAECELMGVPVVREYTMGQLGRACQIHVGASVVAELA